jgi:hypothetical protein
MYILLLCKVELADYYYATITHFSDDSSKDLSRKMARPEASDR